MCQAKKTLQASILLVVRLLAFVSLTWSSTSSSVAKNVQPELWPWQQSIQKINAARERGEISTDAAALYRLTAIQDPHQLPEKFQPDSFDVNQPLPTDGMMELAEKLLSFE